MQEKVKRKQLVIHTGLDLL